MVCELFTMFFEGAVIIPMCIMLKAQNTLENLVLTTKQVIISCKCSLSMQMSPCKHLKTLGFVMFSGCAEREHGPEI